MAEGNVRLEGDQTSRFRRNRGRLGDAQHGRCTPDQQGVSGRIARRDEDQRTDRTRQGSDSAPEALLDPGVEGRGRRQAEAAREFCRRQAVRQLDERQGVAAGLDDQAFHHLLVQRGEQDGLEERPRIAVAEGLDVQFRQAREGFADVARRKDEPDSFGHETARDKGERQRGASVQPVGVIDQPEDRLLGRE